MRKLLRRLLPVFVAAAALSGLLATGASAKTLHFTGSGLDDPGNQSQAKVEFKVKTPRKSNKLLYAFNFEATKIGYPNVTPPIPVGEPKPLCGSRLSSYLFTALEDPTPLDANKLHFDSDTPDEFFRKSQYPDAPYNNPYEEWIVRGFVSKHKGGWKATGFFVHAQSEGGLQYAGCSTGKVHWDAKAD